MELRVQAQAWAKTKKVLKTMAEMKNVRINSREFLLGLLIILLSLFMSFVFPLFAPVLALMLIVGGIFAYRHNTDVTTRTIAVVAIAGGIAILLMILLVSVFLVPTHSSMSSSSVDSYT